MQPKTVITKRSLLHYRGGIMAASLVGTYFLVLSGTVLGIFMAVILTAFVTVPMIYALVTDSPPPPTIALAEEEGKE